MHDLLSIAHFLPTYLHDVEDYLSLTSVSRPVRISVQEYTTPHALLLLCHASRRVFFRPEPLFLLTALSPGISHFAALSNGKLRRVVQSFWEGDDTLISFVIATPAIASYAQWNLPKIRALWEWRMRVLNPLSDLIDKCVGKQWYDTPDFWDGGAEDAATLFAEPEELAFRLIMYGEMFGQGWELWLSSVERGEPNPIIPPAFSVASRLEFLKYMMPDWHVPPQIAASSRPSPGSSHDLISDRPLRPGEVSYYTEPFKLTHTETGYTRRVSPYKAVQTASGPYINFYTNPTRDILSSEFQASAIHLLCVSPLWAQIAKRVRERCGGDFDSDSEGDLRDHNRDMWTAKGVKQDLWENALYMLGGEGMEMLMQTWKAGRGQEHSREKEEILEAGPGWAKLRGWRNNIAGMEDSAKLDQVKVGQSWTYETPHFLRDMHVLVSDR